MDKQFKVGDRVKGPDGSVSTIVRDCPLDHRRWHTDLGDSPAACFTEEELELIQEEPMHPYLTPEKIEQLRREITDLLVIKSETTKKLIEEAVETVLEREANPPPKIRTFKLIFPGNRKPDTGHEIASIMADAGYTAIVEEVPS